MKSDASSSCAAGGAPCACAGVAASTVGTTTAALRARASRRVSRSTGATGVAFSSGQRAMPPDSAIRCSAMYRSPGLLGRPSAERQAGGTVRALALAGSMIAMARAATSSSARALAAAFAFAGLGWTAGCSSTPSASPTGVSTEGGFDCPTGGPLVGGAYDIGKSKFAFGSAPVAVDAGALVRWTGSEGVVAVFADGSEMALLDASAPAGSLPGWSSEVETLSGLVTSYYVSMGVESCQIAGIDATYSAGGGGSTDGGSAVVVEGQTIVGLARAVDGIPVEESTALAQFDVQGQTTDEAFYWPELPADVVSAAIAFRDQLAMPGALAAFKATLPADAQGDGHVVIHHHVAGTTGAFVAVATYQTVQITPDDDGGDLYFAPNGQPMTDTWSGF
jgi:hypothetical protein